MQNPNSQILQTGTACGFGFRVFVIWICFGFRICLRHRRSELYRRISFCGMSVSANVPAEKLTARFLDESTALRSMRQPELFRSIHETKHVSEGQLTLDLPPYATVRLNPQQ
jgi:hypothetical protein